MDKMTAQREYWLTTGDFDEGNNLKPAALLNYFQDVASWHSWLLHAGYPELLLANKIWVLIKNKFVLYEQPPFFSGLKIITWPLKTDKIYYPRVYQIRNNEEKVIGEGMSLWAIINLNTQMVAREQWYLGETFKNEQPFAFEKKIPAAFDEHLIDQYTVRSFEIDHYHHMNNAVYANLIHLVADKLHALPITNLEIHYLKQAKRNDVIDLYYHEDDHHLFIIGKNKSQEIIFSSIIKKS